MKITKTCMATLAAAALVSGAAFAQDDFGFGSFDNNTTAESSDGFGDFGDFGGSGSGSSSSEPTVTINGTVEANARMYVRKGSLETDAENADSTVYADNLDDIQKFPTESDPSVSLDLAYSGANTEFEGTLAFSKSILEDNPEDVLEDFTARLYLGNWQFEAGKMKIVWGKGDKVHVLDNFNANDYTDYIIPDYIDRRIAEPAFRAVYSTASGIKVEGVYTPMMTADRLASSGVWKPAKMTTLENSIASIVKSNLAYYAAQQSLAEAAFAQAYASYVEDTTNTTAATAFATAKSTYSTATENYLTYLSYSSELASDSSSLYPDTQKLKYGQAGVRSTFSIGSVDLGLSYYYGHYKQPTANLKNYIASTVAGSDIKALPEIDYDQVQIFGIEGATILFGSFNSRFELAYNLTKDVAGDDPWVKNNSIGWVFGFDKDLPINEVNINVQTQGSYILGSDKIDDDELTGNATVDAALHAKGLHGAEYDADGIYTNNKIIVDITDSYNHNKVKVDLKGIYGIERKDLIIMPTLTLNPRDDFTLNVSGLAIHSFDKDKSEFAGWLNNDFVEISCKYQF